MIDCHCHLLPGIDDGARDMPTALAMARRALASSIQAAILTPHHNDGAYVNDRDSILAGVAQFRQALLRAELPLTVFPGSELHIVPELISDLEQGRAMTYADLYKAALLELPKSMVPQGAPEIIRSVGYLGLTPVIAHPERNAELCRAPEKLETWIEEGVTFQLTTQSCSGMFGKEIQAACKFWIQRGWAHFVASDAHRTERRSPDMRKGVAQITRWAGEEVAHIMCHENPRRLTAGEEVLTPPVARPLRKRMFTWLRG